MRRGESEEHQGGNDRVRSDVGADQGAIQYRMLLAGEGDVLARVADGVFDHAVQPALARAYLDDPRLQLAAALHADVVVGIATGIHYLHPDKPSKYFVNEVGVANAYRGQGIGRRLLSALLQHARRCGCREAWLGTEQGNVAARRMYAALGGREDPEAVVLVWFDLSADPETVPGPAASETAVSLDAMLCVRRPVVGDAARIAALSLQLGHDVTEAGMLSRLETLARHPEHAVRVAERDGVVVGWIHVAVTRALQYDPCAEILGLIVDEQVRGSGVGAALVAAAEAWARRQPVAELRVRSRETRADAHRFYHREGFLDWKRQLVFRKRLDHGVER